MEDKITRLSIKADRSGIAVYVPAHMSTDEICAELYHRFKINAYAFEKRGTVAVNFRGDSLTENESYRIIDFLNRLDMSNVSFMLGQRSVKNAAAKYADPISEGRAHNKYRSRDSGDLEIESNSGFTEKNRPYIFIGNIGRKQTLEIKGNIIIIGNVSRDARVVSGGNITVIGDLYGTAIAGKCRKENSFVLAMHMEPKFLQIGRCRSDHPDIVNYADSSVLAANDGASISITYI